MSKTPYSRKRPGTPTDSRRKYKAARRLSPAFSAVATPRIPRSFMRSSIIPTAPFPLSKRVSLTYAQWIPLDASTAFPTVYRAFRANGAYDPDVAVGGHQPYGWDQWTTVYDQYMVESSYIEAVFSAVPQANLPQVVGIQLGDDATISAMNELIWEQDNTVSAMTDSTNVKLRMSFDAKKFFAGKQVDSLQAVNTADPTELAHFNVFTSAFDAGVDNPAPIKVFIRIVYNIVFSERKRFGQS